MKEENDTLFQPPWWQPMRISGLYLAVYGVIFAYFGYALFRYATVEYNGGYSTCFWYLHGPIHEIGHVVCGVFPETLCILGGSLFQCLAPIACGGYFLLSHEKHAFTVALGWLGFALLDLAAYMRDALEMELPLVSPFASEESELIHDWNWLFCQWGVLHRAHGIGGCVAAVGYGCVVLAMLLMILLALLPKNTRKRQN